MNYNNIGKKEIRAALYLRSKQNKMADFHKQSKKCKEYAEKRNIKITGTHTDLNEVIKGNYDAVIIAQKSVIARNVFEYKIKEQVLKHKGIKIIIAG